MIRFLARFFLFLLLIVVLVGGFYWWKEVRQGVFETINQGKNALSALRTLANYVLFSDNKEHTFLVLFQNNWELRPGGGFIGSFGIVKIKNGKLTSLQIHNIGVFDGRIPDIVPPPYPLGQMLRIPSLKLSDSNVSPDFSENARQAEYFYKLGQGQEQFDGVIGITANVLTSLLDITGPITLEGYPGTYSKEDAIYTLEYQVEVGYKDQGIPKTERKSVMQALANAIMQKLQPLDTFKKVQLAQATLYHLKTKDIQLYFKDPALEAQVVAQNWGGIVNPSWTKDYLLMVDSNLGGLKSDYFIKRSARYGVDLSKPTPKAILQITYHHTAPKRDWLANRYRTYLRVYAPQGSWLTDTNGLDKPTFSAEFNKTVFGFIVDVPINEQKTVELTYTLPPYIKDHYDLLIQKQAGVSDEPVNVTIIKSDGTKEEHNVMLRGDAVLSQI